MNIPLYCMIFVSKILENALATLRLIVVANGKKWFGASLQFIVALVWVFVAGVVVTGIKEDPLKVVVFALGSFIGSYVGSVIEEKIALGNNMLMVSIDVDKAEVIIKSLKQQHYGFTILNSTNKIILMIVIPRKERQEVIDIITKYDENAFISAEKVVPIKTYLRYP